MPVALFVYRRHTQLPRTLECLRESGVRRLHVFSDGARDASDAQDVAQVRQVLRSVDWTEPVTVEHGENLGLSRSIGDGLDSLFETHEAVIVIEDDICVAPEFYDYARLALAHYEPARALAGITGLRYPFDRRVLRHYPYDVFLSPRFSSWAWATWRDRWQEFDFDADALRRRMGAADDFRPERAGADLPAMLHEAVVTESLGGSWDVMCAANMLLSGQYFLTPTWNMVENTGLSEGTHSSKAPPWELHWEQGHRPDLEEIRFCEPVPDETVLQEYRRFFARQDAGGGALTQARLAAARWRSTRRLRRAWGRL